MDGEFKVVLKEYDQAELVKAFKEDFNDNFSAAFEKSAYKTSGALQLTDFCAGYLTRDSLFLVYNREGDIMKVYVETPNARDLNNLKNTINKYFGGITKMLDKRKMKWSSPEATITLENLPLYGFIKTWKDKLKDLIRDQKEKLFIVPFGSLFAVYLAIHWNFVRSDDASKDLKKAVISTLEAYLGFLILVCIQLFFAGKKRKFTFNF